MLRSTANKLAGLPNVVLFALLFAAVALSHLTLLHLPYYWDEGGYYIPAALDFYHRWTLIPEFTNAHPPLPNVTLGLLWHLTGYHILATRLCVSAFAAASLLAIFRLTQNLLTPSAAAAVTLLTATYPIWFAQSTLAHADIFAAAFTLSAFAIYLTKDQEGTEAVGKNCHPERSEGPASRQTRQAFSVALLFSLAALSKETAILEPATLAAIELVLLLKTRNRAHLRWLLALSFPLLPLLAWYAFHHHQTGFTFGNPEYLRYNATANLSATHIVTAIRYRFLHLFWQRNIWLPIVFALACFFLPSREEEHRLSPITLRTIGILVLANWMAFSVLGGALLTRYLLPIYPLILLVCLNIWREHTNHWPTLTAITAAAFVSALWINPPTSFAPEDNLTYRDMIVVQQHAAAYVTQHYPGAHVLTAWPMAAELFRPDLGYVPQQIKVTSIENFTLPEVLKAAQTPGNFDTAVVFTTHYVSPALAHYLLQHPSSPRGREFAEDRDLTPDEIARILHGTKVWSEERDGEWAAVIRFNRIYDASLNPTQLINAAR